MKCAPRLSRKKRSRKPVPAIHSAIRAFYCGSSPPECPSGSRRCRPITTKPLKSEGTKLVLGRSSRPQCSMISDLQTFAPSTGCSGPDEALEVPGSRGGSGRPDERVDRSAGSAANSEETETVLRVSVSCSVSCGLEVSETEFVCFYLFIA